jgi:hypothetical protein
MRRLTAFLTLLFAGCAGYHIGPVQPKFMEGVRSIAVPTFKNETLEPRVEVLVANTVIRQIQQDGTYRVATIDQADAVLEGTILQIRRQSARSVRGNVIATREFNLTVELQFTVTRKSDKKVLANRSITGVTSFFVSGDVQQDERQAIPLAVEDAAVRLVSLISEGW